MRTSAICLLAGLGCASALAAVPTVSNVRVAQNGSTRLVTVTYDLADADAVVTVDFTTNGVSIGAANFTNATGAVNCRVAAGNGRTFEWDPLASWPDRQLTNAVFGARLRAWALNAPPPYMTADVADGAVRYYASAEAVPGSVSNETYKTQKLLLRLIPANRREFTMGAPASLSSVSDSSHRETLHQVTLTNDFYLCIYETTQRQWELVKGNRPSVANNDACYEMRPVEYVSYRDIRGASLGLQWPANDEVDATSFLGVLRERTGVRFDLPTDAQWEFACRAGTMTALYTGTDSCVTSTETPIARCNGNGGMNWDSGVDTSGATAVVGSYLPNAFGLYDMIGNVYEWCLDRCPSDGSISADDVVDPLGVTTSTDYRVKHGGCAESYYRYDRASYRSVGKSSSQARTTGFRVALRLH